MGTEGYLGWALQGYSAVGHCKDSFWLGPTGIFDGWSLKSASSRARTTSTLKSDNPTARVGKNQQFLGGGSILCRFVLHLMRLVMHVYPWLLSRTSSLTCNVHRHLKISVCPKFSLQGCSLQVQSCLASGLSQHSVSAMCVLLLLQVFWPSAVSSRFICFFIFSPGRAALANSSIMLSFRSLYLTRCRNSLLLLFQEHSLNSLQCSFAGMRLSHDESTTRHHVSPMF